MTGDYRNAFEKVYLTVKVDDRNRWVHTDWFGYLTKENIRSGALAYTQAVKESGYACVLNDTRNVVGGWDHSLDWVVNEWSPRAAESGIKFFALITTPESFAEATASGFFSSVRDFEVRIFQNMGDAQGWLRQQQVKS